MFVFVIAIVLVAHGGLIVLALSSVDDTEN